MTIPSQRRQIWMALVVHVSLLKRPCSCYPADFSTYLKLQSHLEVKVVCLIRTTVVIFQGAEKARTGVSVVGTQTEVQTTTVGEGMDEAVVKGLDEGEGEDGGSHCEALTTARRLMEAALKETPTPIHLDGQDAGSRLYHSRLQLVDAHISGVISNLTPGSVISFDLIVW
ncbi:hypothetical protein FRC12_023104 [Ceratobasidium sp. 428]|nr:hypothetical protein FRC12_023104 [Ceratobasidium sp. 428]